MRLTPEQRAHLRQKAASNRKRWTELAACAMATADRLDRLAAKARLDRSDRVWLNGELGAEAEAWGLVVRNREAERKNALEFALSLRRMSSEVIDAHTREANRSNDNVVALTRR
jgi:hypothetical protein